MFSRQSIGLFGLCWQLQHFCPDSDRVTRPEKSCLVPNNIKCYILPSLPELCRQMKSATIHEIKQELTALTPQKLLDVTLRLARFKKENKELLNYLLFESHNLEGYIESVKNEIDEQFATLPQANWYLAKKGLRKIIRGMNKHGKYTGSKEFEVEILLHFCNSLKHSDVPIYSYKALTNLYEMQLKKLQIQIKLVHEDLRFDYNRKLEILLHQEDNISSVKTAVPKMKRK